MYLCRIAPEKPSITGSKWGISSLLRRGPATLGLVMLISMPLQETRAQSLDLNTQIRVRTAAVANIAVGSNGLATGTVKAFRQATVAAEIPGRIVERLAEPGTPARQGQVLLRIDAERALLRLQRSEAMAEAARIDWEHLTHEYQRSLRLLAKKVVSQDAVDDLRFAEANARARLQAARVEVSAAQRDVRDAEVRAPFDGQVETVAVQVGDYVNPGQAILTQTDFSQARVIAGVTSRDAALILSGSTASIVFDDLGGQALDATVTSVGKVKDQIAGTYPVELRIAGGNAASALREGMVGSVAWHAQSDPVAAALSIPTAALVRHEGRIGTYVIEADKAYLRDIRIGRSDGQRVEVLSGLSAGQEVVTDGQFALRDGAPVVRAATPGR